MDTHVDPQLDRGRLHRSRRDRIVFGVCGGLGEYFDLDPVLIRLAFVLISLVGGAGVLAYLILAVVLPEQDVSPEPGREGLRRNLESLKSDANEFAGDLRGGLGDDEGAARQRRGQQIGGLILLGLGLFFLANSLGWLAWWNWQQFWPVVLIVFGLAFLLRREG
jgi:phage shock protein PspC (stress-responsive transcriptional regulator)